VLVFSAVDTMVSRSVLSKLCQAARIHRAGVGSGCGKVFFKLVASLGFICSAVMTLRLKGLTPVARKAALIVSTLNASKNASPKT